MIEKEIYELLHGAGEGLHGKASISKHTWGSDTTLTLDHGDGFRIEVTKGLPEDLDAETDEDGYVYIMQDEFAGYLKVGTKAQTLNRVKSWLKNVK